jgi:hypothetical protein
MWSRAALIIASLGFCTSMAAAADGIDPGLWQISTRIATGVALGPPQLSQKCLTPAQTNDLAATFSPVAGTINSECAPLERNFVDGKLTWKLVCKGQLNLELTGEFNFDSPRHYTATIHNRAEMGGQQVANSQNVLEARWLSECPAPKAP